MIIQNAADGHNIPSREITPPETYFSRRTFLRGAALVGGVAATAGLYRLLAPKPPIHFNNVPTLLATPSATLPDEDRIALGYAVDEKVDPKTSYDEITNYNNYYEFGTSKEEPVRLAQGFVTDPWSLKIDGLCNKPKTFSLDDLKKVAPLEDRVYRHRCVEAWSMVIPWLGFRLSALLKQVDPKADAKFVAFETFYDKKKMPDAGYLTFPYREGLRMDEAMNPLTLMAMGVYGKILLPQNGAPIRLVVPWKYGFKSAKAIVRITLVADQPHTSWADDQPKRYGFYSNVNPAFSPQDNQATENRREQGQRPTLPFNGYGAQVAAMYKDMDLTKFY